MAAPNDFQPSVGLSFKTLRVTEREIEIRLRLILRQARYTTVVSTAANSMTVPRSTGIAWGSRQQLVVIEIDVIAAEALPLQLEHLWVCEDIH